MLFRSEHAWHYDESEYTVTLSLQTADEGGAFEFTKPLRNSSDDLAAAATAAVVSTHSTYDAAPRGGASTPAVSAAPSQPAVAVPLLQAAPKPPTVALSPSATPSRSRGGPAARGGDYAAPGRGLRSRGRARSRSLVAGFCAARPGPPRPRFGQP